MRLHVLILLSILSTLGAAQVSQPLYVSPFMQRFVSSPDAPTGRARLEVSPATNGNYYGGVFIGQTNQNSVISNALFIAGGGSLQSWTNSFYKGGHSTGVTNDDGTAGILMALDANKVPTTRNATESDITLSDVTTLNASTSAHGLLKKLSGVSTEYLNGNGSFAAITQGSAITNLTTGNGLTNTTAGIISLNIAAGSGVTITTNAGGSETISVPSLTTNNFVATSYGISTNQQLISPYNTIFSNLTTTVGFTNNGLTANRLIQTDANKAQSSLSAGTSTTILHGNASGAPTWGAVSLTADVTGTLGVANGGSGTGTTFTQGSVIYSGASGVYSQDNSNFFWDDTNHRLGIGTTSPAAKIDAQSTTEQLRLKYDVSHYTSFAVSSAGNQTITPSGGLLSISGKVGINTPALSNYGLDLAGVLRISGASSHLILSNTAAGTDGKIWYLDSSGSNSTFRVMAVDDAIGTFNQGMNITRSGASIVAVSFPNGYLSVGGGANIAGAATNGALTANTFLYANSSKVITSGSAGTTTTVLHGNASGAPTFSAVSLTADVTGTLPIANGGSGQTTASAAFDAFSPTTTRGDIIARGASSNGRLAIGSSGKFLKSDGTDPSWQSLTVSDIGSGAALTRVDDSNVTLTLGGSPTTALLSATSITAGWNGQLAISRGGTGQSTSNAAFNALSPANTRGDLVIRDASANSRLAIGSSGKYLRSDGTDPSWQTISSSDISGAALTRTDDANVTLTLGGSASTALLNSASITAGWNGQLSIARGGTGQSTSNAAFNALSPVTTRGDLIVRDASANTRLAIGASGKYLRSDGTDPSWQVLSASDLSGLVAMAKGGTGNDLSAITQGNIPYKSATTALTSSDNYNFNESTGLLKVAGNGSYPGIRIGNTSGGTDSKYWDFISDSGGHLAILLRDDSGSGTTAPITITRSGTSSGGITFSTISGTGVSLNGATWFAGTGSPEGVITTGNGSFYSRTDGGTGTSFYVKETSSGNTGWVAK